MKKVYFLLSFLCLVFVMCSCSNGLQDTEIPTTSNPPVSINTSTPPVSDTTYIPPDITPPSPSYLPTDINVEYILISPKEKTIDAYEIADFSATAHLSSGEELDITPQTDFSIEDGAGGMWFYNSYVSENPGTWKVTALFQHPSDGYASWTDSATITVLPDD